MRFHVASPNAQHGVALVNASFFLLSSHICSSRLLLRTTPVRQLFSASRPKEQARNSRSPFDLFHFTAMSSSASLDPSTWACEETARDPLICPPPIVSK